MMKICWPGWITEISQNDTLREKTRHTQSDLAQALGVSVIELMAGERTENRNVSANLLRGLGRLYLCCNRHGLMCRKK